MISRSDRVAEKITGFLGSMKFLMWMTVFIIVWITWNVAKWFGFAWDGYPFILLNLIFSTQASYAAPLLLMAGNISAQRDRINAANDLALDEESNTDIKALQTDITAIKKAMGLP